MGAEVVVEVAYAKPDVQVILKCKVPKGCTASRAVELSGILDRFPEINLPAAKLGIFGKVVEATEILRSRDRVEIYRPLRADPREVRRLRAAAGQRLKKDAGATEGD